LGAARDEWPQLHVLAPIITDYLKQYPEVALELVCTARAVDLVEERLTSVSEQARYRDSTLIARILGRVTLVPRCHSCVPEKAGAATVARRPDEARLLVFWPWAQRRGTAAREGW